MGQLQLRMSAFEEKNHQELNQFKKENQQLFDQFWDNFQVRSKFVYLISRIVTNKPFQVF